MPIAIWPEISGYISRSRDYLLSCQWLYVDVSPKPPEPKNPFTVIKNWKNLNRKLFLCFCRLFCMRLLRLAPWQFKGSGGPKTETIGTEWNEGGTG